MHTHITLRDLTMITLLAAALVVYGLGLVSQAFAAGGADNTDHVCVLSDANVKAIDRQE